MAAPQGMTIRFWFRVILGCENNEAIPSRFDALMSDEGIVLPMTIHELGHSIGLKHTQLLGIMCANTDAQCASTVVVDRVQQCSVWAGNDAAMPPCASQEKT